MNASFFYVVFDKVDIFIDLYYNLICAILCKTGGFIVVSSLMFDSLPSVMVDIDNIKSSRDKSMFVDRMSGMTAAELGRKYSLTRERVRQCLSSNLRYLFSRRDPVWFDVNGKKVPCYYKEDKFFYFYNTYAVTEKQICSIFNEPCSTGAYLVVRSGRRTFASRFDLSLAFEDSNLSDDTLNLLNSYFCSKRHTFLVDGERVRLSMKDIVREVMKKNGGLMRLSDIERECRSFLMNLGLSPLDSYVQNFRLYKYNIIVFDFVLKCNHHCYKYCDFDQWSLDEIISDFNLDKFHNVELSAVYLIRMNPSVLKKYGLDDEYQVHNFLRRVCADKLDISFTRMPIIRFGNGDRKKQALDYLSSEAPMSRRSFLNAFCGMYGFSEASLVGLMTDKDVTSCFLSADNDSLDIGNIGLTESFCSKISDCLKDDFYTRKQLDAVLNPFRYALNGIVLDFDSFTQYLACRLGFISYSDCVVRNHRGSADRFFKYICSTDDFVNISVLQGLSRFSYRVRRLLASYNLFRYSDTEYVTIHYLNSIGIDKEMINDFLDKVVAWSMVYAKDKPFTVQYILRSFEHPLLSEYKDFITVRFIETLLLIRNNIFNKIRFKGCSLFMPRIFCKGDDLVGLLIRSIVIENGSDFSLEFIRNVLFEEYGLNASVSDILLIIKSFDDLFVRFADKQVCYVS